MKFSNFRLSNLKLSNLKLSNHTKIFACTSILFFKILFIRHTPLCLIYLQKFIELKILKFPGIQPKLVKNENFEISRILVGSNHLDRFILQKLGPPVVLHKLVNAISLLVLK